MSAKFRIFRRGKFFSILMTLVVIALVGAVIGLGIKLDRQTTTNRIGGEAYSIGAIDEKLGSLPGYADEVTWVAIWNAAKRMVRDRMPGIEAGSEKFYT